MTIAIEPSLYFQGLAKSSMKVVVTGIIGRRPAAL